MGSAQGAPTGFRLRLGDYAFLARDLVCLTSNGHGAVQNVDVSALESEQFAGAKRDEPT